MRLQNAIKCSTIWLVAPVCLSTLGHLCQAAPQAEVSVVAAKKTYVLGEPVLLDVSIKNTATEPFTAREVFDQKVGVCPDIRVFLAEGAMDEDAPFREFVPESCVNAESERPAHTLPPGDSWRYQLRVVYDGRPRGLAFPVAGAYRAKVEYPLLIADARRTGGINAAESARLESNSTLLNIREPQGVDARVWQNLNSPRLLYLLQWGATTDEHEHAPLEAATILKTVPNSSYHPGLRWAIKTYYERNVDRLDEHEAELFRSVAGIEVPPPQPFPDDERLGQIITYHFPKRTPWEDVFQQISEQSGVGLEIDAALRVRTMSSVRVTEPLRQFMRNQATYKAEWEPKGEGYLLRFVDPKNEQTK